MLFIEDIIFFRKFKIKNQSFDDFVTKVKNKAVDCDFGDLTESLIRDRIVLGVLDKNLTERYLQDPDLTLSKAIALGRAAESSRTQLKEIKEEKHLVIKIQNINLQRKIKFFKACRKCASKHNYGNCPAYGKQCNKCKKPNHYAKCCKNKIVHDIAENDIYMHVLSVDNILRDGWFETIYIQGHPINFKIDTGADVNILPVASLKFLQGKYVITPTNKNIFTYTKERIPIVGEVELECQFQSKKSNSKFFVVKCQTIPILGLKDCSRFGLIEKVNSLHQCINNISFEVILNKYKDVFEGVGLLKNKQSILIKEDAIPQVYTARRLPLALREPVREELEKMSKLGVIKKINKPTEWSHPIVVVKKPNGDVRICIDPRKLNYWIKRERYMMPSPEEVLALIPKANIYTVLDAKYAFWQIPLTDEVSLLTTMSTPYGRYCYTRMPYGLSSAPEIFQRIIHQLYLGVPNVVTYMDDVLIYSDSETEHLKILEQVLKIARENGLKFDKTKTQLMQPSVRYLGHIVSTEGIRPLESKVKAILDMPRPQDKKALQRFLGMVTYLAKFLPNLDLKLQLTSAPCLRHFDPKLDIEISTDASSNGLGAVLQQQGVPITYSSTALSAAQKKYSQIEKELLAVYFGCKRNHLYLYGRKFTAFTDHKPLLTIMKKPMVDLSPRLQRLVLQLQHYDFDLKYIPGKKLYTADALSRDYIANDLFITPEIEISQNNQVLMVTYSNNRHQDFVEATNNDPVLQEVKNYIENGWPIHKKTMNPLVKPFWDIKEELFEWEGLLCRGVKLVIPEKRRNHILSLLHKAHRGINSTLSLARSTFYWPGMCQEVEEFVKKCRICQKYSRNNTKEPLILHETGNYPFQKIGVDLFEIEGRKYLGIVDYYTKYPEVFELRSTKAEMVIEKLKEVFARFGVPEIMMTDNGPPFQSTEMMEFAKEWNVTHTTSSPRFPQSNGMIERTIQTLKSTIIKCQQSKQDIYQALLLLRNTEHNSLPSPAVMLYGRKQRLFLPMKTTLMNESRICEDSIRKQHEANQSRMKFYFNRHTMDLPSLENGQSVLVRQEKQWSPAKVIAPGVHPRSYLLEDTKGSVLRRNRRDLRPADTLSGPTKKKVLQKSKNNLTLNHLHLPRARRLQPQLEPDAED
ncbi:K02A2.6-like [Cordylochernes scorpioides]|uniref:RNA-directed DNA polymerase n=1 Tax=Cordylochernes scorpioides TaxID=51811 RepID=A0ABY6LDS7_9ARAC|nr:K02A2.6-like [Cordylochernes scorpioides]